MLWLPVQAVAVTVAVAPIADSSSKGQGAEVAKQVEAGLDGAGFTVISSVALVTEAQSEGLSAGDLAKPVVLMPVVKTLAGEAVLTGVIEKKNKKDEQLQVRVFDLNGVELWSRAIPLVKGRLAPEVPAKIAKAVTAARLAAKPEGRTIELSVPACPASSRSKALCTGNQPDNRGEAPAPAPCCSSRCAGRGCSWCGPRARRCRAR